MSADDSELAALMSALLDGGLNHEEQIRLNHLIQSSDDVAAQVADHLLMDSLLDETLGPDSLSAMVDMLGGRTNTRRARRLEVLAAPLAWGPDR